MQFGSGLGGGGCDLPHLAAHAALALGEATGQCSALLFDNGSTAFAAMVRETVLPTLAGRESWMRILVSRCFICGFAVEVVDFVSAVCNWEDAGMSSHFISVLRDFHEHMWFSLEFLAGITTSVRGCAAGSRVADFFYCE